MNHLVVVVKNPLPGAVKTRLQTRYSATQAAALYRAFILDTLARTEKIPIDRRTIAYDPPDAGASVRDLCGPDWAYEPQKQAGLGTRMHDALARCLTNGASAAVLIGTDLPSLPAEHIQHAFESLKTRDVVLGPSTDGGYYLVGLSRPFPELFRDIPWSTSQVLAQTLLRLREHNRTLGLVPVWFDVDTPKELDVLTAHADAQLAASGCDPIPHTRACLATLT